MLRLRHNNHDAFHLLSSFPHRRAARIRAALAMLPLLGLLSTGSCLAQIPAAAPVTEAERNAVLERMATLLEERYVFADRGARMADSLRADARARAYSGIENPEALARALSARIRSLSGDGHLWVMAQPEPAESPAGEPASEAKQALVPTHHLRTNFGFPKAEILPGNVGYLDIRQFLDPGIGGETVAAAMAYLGNAEALVLDLRASMGGSQGMVALLASWLFEAGTPVHLFDSYHRASDRTVQSWTLNYLPGPRFVDKPVYVLTAARTFSAGEALAYILKHLERATVVGETTGGGANPGAFHRLNPRFVMFVAESQVTSPVTGGNWEGTGVQPHVAVPAEEAIETAHRLALERLREIEAGEEGRREP
jgi:retinol-binding protein 3